MRNLLFLLAVFLGLTCLAATEYTSADGRFTYKLTNGVATIAKYIPADGDTSVVIPSSLGGCPVVTLGAKSFMNTLRVPEKDDGIRFSLVIPDTVRVIGEYAFDGCTRMEHVSIPGSVETIGDYAFKGCVYLASISFDEGVAQIGRSAFSNSAEASIVDLHGVLRLTFPSTLKSLGNTAFAGNQNVGEVVFRAPLEKTGTSAFVSCQYLKRVMLAKGQTEITERMFQYCYALEEINIPSTVADIGQYAFERCRSLGVFEVPPAVASIGTAAFKGCRGLREVTVPEGAEIAGWPFEKGTVVHVSGTVVPSGCKPSGTVSVPAGDSAWRTAVTAAGGMVVEDVMFETEADLTMAQKAYCLGSVQAGEKVVRVVGDAATIAACDALGIAPNKTVVAAKSRAATGNTVTLTFAEPKVEVVACDFVGRTLTVRVVPGEGTRRASVFLPPRFVAEGGPSLGELSLWRASATSAAETDAELTAEEKAYTNSGLVTFVLPNIGTSRSAFWRAAVR